MNAKVPSCLGNLDLRQFKATKRASTLQVKRNKQNRRVVVSADGVGVVSHAGVGLLRETGALQRWLAPTVARGSMRRDGSSPTSLSRSLMVRTRSAVSACWVIGRICTGRWLRCRLRGESLTGSATSISRTFGLHEHWRVNGRGL